MRQNWFIQGVVASVIFAGINICMEGFNKDVVIETLGFAVVFTAFMYFMARKKTGSKHQEVE